MAKPITSIYSRLSSAILWGDDYETNRYRVVTVSQYLQGVRVIDQWNNLAFSLNQKLSLFSFTGNKSLEYW